MRLTQFLSGVLDLGPQLLDVLSWQFVGTLRYPRRQGPPDGPKSYRGNHTTSAQTDNGQQTGRSTGEGCTRHLFHQGLQEGEETKAHDADEEQDAPVSA